MNVFLHSLDQCFSFLAIRSQPIHYLRYADDMLLGIPLGTEEEKDSLKIKDSLRSFVFKEFQRCALNYEWVEVQRPNIQAQSQLELLGGPPCRFIANGRDTGNHTHKQVASTTDVA
jgi:hypothetical protein